MPKYFLNVLFIFFLALVVVFNYFKVSLSLLSLTLLIAFIAEYFMARLILKTYLPIQPIKLNFSQKLYKDKLDKELAMAKKVQQSLLNAKFSPQEGILVAKRCVPADSIGGDFFIFIESYPIDEKVSEKQRGIIKFSETQQNCLGFAIGDVAGHGISSALVMALSAGIFEEIGKQSLEPAKVLKSVNADLVRVLQDTDISHVTASYLVINPQDQVLTYSRAGHTPLMILKKNEESIQEFHTEGVYLGLFDAADYETIQISLSSGDRIICYTDGIVEARNYKDDCFGIDAFKNILKQTKELAVANAVEEVFRSLSEFRGASLQKDDCTLVMMDVL